MFPLSILRVWIVGVLSLAILGGGGYLIWEWYDGEQEREYLWAGTILLGVSLLGRWLLIPLLGMGTLAEPRLTRKGESQRVYGADGNELYVEMHGPTDAPPVVLLHGWALDSRAWYYAKRELGDRFRLVTWDLRGTGNSTRPQSNDYGLKAQAADLKRVLGVVGQPVSLVGHSIGGMIIQEFCQQFPQELGTRVGRIVLVDTTFTNPLHHTPLRGLARVLEKPLIVPLLHLTIWTSPLVWLMNWLSYQNGTLHITTRIGSFAGGQTWKQVDFVSRLSVLQSPAVLARGTLAMLSFDAQATLPEINVPVLIVHGKNDRTLQLDAAEHLQRTIPESRLQVLEPAGHQLILEQHEELARAVETFATEKPEGANMTAVP